MLIEVLVALLIFVLGIMGLVGLQTGLTRSLSDSKVRADAAYLASEVVGRMWTDIGNIDGYAGDECATAGCAEWRTKVAQMLPDGDAQITVDEATGDVSITLDWTMPGGAKHSYVTKTTIVSKKAGIT